jgi:hypothetical protein
MFVYTIFLCGRYAQVVPLCPGSGLPFRVGLGVRSVGFELVNLSHLGIEGILDLDLPLVKKLVVNAHLITGIR